ncbi:hypothetical protein LCGC14_2952280, partial [marine sediment metagenome]
KDTTTTASNAPSGHQRRTLTLPTDTDSYNAGAPYRVTEAARARIGGRTIMAIVFLGTPSFAVPSLRRLVDDGFDIKAVYTQPDRPAGRGRRPTAPPVKSAALEIGLPVHQPDSLRDPSTLAELASLHPEAAVGVAFGQILRQEVLEIPSKGVLNVHPSLLPRHRGASPAPAAILAGDHETGVTIILMDPGMDSGPILAQRRLPIDDSDTAGTLMEKLSHVAADLVAETLPRWLSDEIEPQPQDHSLATKAPLLKKEHGAIDWALAADEIWRRVRAYNPWPGAYTTLDGRLLHIWEAWPLADGGAAPGTVVSLSAEQQAGLPPATDQGAFGVATGEGVLAVLAAQREGRRRLTASEFLRGMREFIGRRLGS